MTESIKKRKGICHYWKCKNLCCGYFSCHHWDPKTGKCHIYKDRPILNCKFSPFDEKDKVKRIKDICGFYWEDKK